MRDGLRLEPGLKVGLLGGSFNPAHEGHAHVAETAMQRLGLDRVIWLVSPQNPLKDDSETAPLVERMASAREFARGPAMVVSDFESRVGCRWTVDTLRAVTARHPGVKFVWLMGSDNLATFHRWRGWTDIAAAMPMAVIAGRLPASKPHRPGGASLRRLPRAPGAGPPVAGCRRAGLDLPDRAPEPGLLHGDTGRRVTAAAIRARMRFKSVNVEHFAVPLARVRDASPGHFRLPA
ncbi:nicotinate-nucleotide adenylyltransferase [Brevundimonas denitrificans]|uniref:nicotinate-nucleotide adenylyltransferase n=1 Tax=Brevundimonas denitrificans TaxID=1443434 RepID=UPI00352E976E